MRCMMVAISARVMVDFGGKYLARLALHQTGLCTVGYACCCPVGNRAAVGKLLDDTAVCRGILTAQLALTGSEALPPPDG